MYVNNCTTILSAPMVRISGDLLVIAAPGERQLVLCTKTTVKNVVKSLYYAIITH
jgi:hypothetical protein